MWELLNLKFDKRTARNILVFPVIVFIRVPLVICYWVVEWLFHNMEYWVDKLPAWKSN